MRKMRLHTLLIVFLLFSLLSPLAVIDAQPEWLRVGVYAVYRFIDAYVVRGYGPDGWELEGVGRGYCRWEVVEVRGSLAVLNVTLKALNLTRSVYVTIDSETMDLVEGGEVWGKAWLWINLAKLPASYPEVKVVRNITVVMNWLNETVKNPTVSRIYSASKESFLKPFRTGLGAVDKKVTVAAWTNITRLKTRDYGGEWIPKEIIGFTPTGESVGLGMSFSYDAKCGLLIAGIYMDDILTQRFNIGLFKEQLLRKGEPNYWIILEDTNLDIGVEEEGFGILLIIKKNYLYILLATLAALFITAFVRGRV